MDAPFSDRLLVDYLALDDLLGPADGQPETNHNGFRLNQRTGSVLTELLFVVRAFSVLSGITTGRFFDDGHFAAHADFVAWLDLVGAFFVG